jgi:hypothetical protein
MLNQNGSNFWVSRYFKIKFNPTKTKLKADASHKKLFPKNISKGEEKTRRGIRKNRTRSLKDFLQSSQD